MECPYCGGDSRVLDSRRSGHDVRRRRECADCSRRFTTYEQVAAPEIKVQKHDHSTQQFDRKRLVDLVARLTHDRRIAPASVEALVRGLEAELVDAGVHAIFSWQIAERLLAKLGELDAIAAQRFALNYQKDDGTIRFRDSESTPQLSLPIAAERASGGDPDG